MVLNRNRNLGQDCRLVVYTSRNRGPARTTTVPQVRPRRAGRSHEGKMKRERLNASGKLREDALTWWAAHMRSVEHVTHIFVLGDGGLRFEWNDGEEAGSFHLPLETLYHAGPADDEGMT